MKNFKRKGFYKIKDLSKFDRNVKPYLTDAMIEKYSNKSVELLYSTDYKDNESDEPIEIFFFKETNNLIFLKEWVEETSIGYSYEDIIHVRGGN